MGIFQSIKVSVPVISVGNITAGGTGKTPHVIYVVEQLLKMGKKTAIISRGYGRNTQGTFIVSDGKQIFGTVKESGDEPYMLAKKIPAAVVIVDANRVRGSQLAIEKFSVDVIVLDDGFQHRKIERDLNIVIIDSQKKNERLLPTGKRREFWSALERSNVIIFSRWSISGKNEIVETIMKCYPHKLILTSEFIPESLNECSTPLRKSITTLANMKILAFCGIGNPDSFQVMLEKNGAIISECISFADHHFYTISDCEYILERYKQIQPVLTVTTEKDSIRLIATPLEKYAPQLKLHTVPILAKFIGNTVQFHNSIQQLFN